MVKRMFVLVLLIACMGTQLKAQYQFNTGDPALDAALNKIDSDAKADPVASKKKLSEILNIPEKKVDEMSEKGMKTGDIYMAGEVSKITKKPIDDVVKVYEANKEKGWGAISKELGIKPGSPEFHALKKDADTHSKKSKAKKEPKKKDQKAKKQ